MADGITCYERDEDLCEDQMCLRVGCRLRNERLNKESKVSCLTNDRKGEVTCWWPACEDEVNCMNGCKPRPGAPSPAGDLGELAETFADRAAKIIGAAVGHKDDWSRHDRDLVNLACEADDVVAALRSAARPADAGEPDAPDLTDPVVVHANMLRGTIARPSWGQIKHLYPEEFAARPAPTREAVKLAVKRLAEENEAGSDGDANVQWHLGYDQALTDTQAAILALFTQSGETGKDTNAAEVCDQCSIPIGERHHPECYRFVDISAVSADDLVPLFRDAASVNMTEESVERQARRFADAVLSLYDVRHK